ncbi:flotillin family protein [Clostridium sp. AF34-10BH]|nr:flotillin family protein [Clostridium sp. AF34-10BH]
MKEIPPEDIERYWGNTKIQKEKIKMNGINIGVIVAVVAVVVVLGILMSGYVKASPDKAYIISGLKKEPKVLIGRAGIKIPFLEKKDELMLRQISIDIKTNGYIPTKDFIGVDIDAVAKVRVLTAKDITVDKNGNIMPGCDPNKRVTHEMVQAAMKNFLNMKEQQIRDALTDSLQGNMREIIGTQCLKELCNDRKTFGDEVQAKAQKDMNALGIWIESCNIQKIEDENNLITALGQDNMSQIQKDASVAKAQADRDVAIARAQAQKDANDAQVIAETEIAQKQTELAIKKAELKKESDIKKAEADAAYKIQEEEQRKTVEITTANANLARQEKELELKEREVSIKEKALEAEVKKTAEANKYAAQQKADAEQYERQKRAEAELFEIQRQAEAEKAKSEAERFAKEQAAEAVKAAGLAEASAVAAKGKAEAEAIQAKAEAEAAGILKKAEAMKQYGDAARQQMELDTLKVYFEQLPKIAEAVAKGYTNVDSIKMFGGNTSQLAGDIMTTITQVSDGIKESTGIDPTEALKGALKKKDSNVKTSDLKDDYTEVTTLSNTSTETDTDKLSEE